jgi:hypothetical protein
MAAVIDRRYRRFAEVAITQTTTAATTPNARSRKRAWRDFIFHAHTGRSWKF